jgi:glycosyltransferase involved in cell wall biosynthesis
MRVCAISFKECWRDASGRWMSDGGFPRQMTAIASLFDEMTLLTTVVPARGGGIPLPETLRLVPLPRPMGIDARRKLSVVAGLPGYARIMATEIRRADAVHVPLPGDLPFIGMMIAQMLRKPLLARYGSSWPINAETTVMNRVTKRWMRLAAGGRNVMLATGEDDRPPAPGMHWIFASALWASELAALSPRLDRGLSSPPRLVYAGRLSSEKGVAVLLRALALLDVDSPGVRPILTIAGDGPERAALEHDAARLLPEGRVTFMGQLDRDALARCLRESDVCVQPSLTEGFSKAWLDAMAHGLPVIASEVGAARAVIGAAGERGLLVPPGDPQALALALARLLAPSSRASFAAPFGSPFGKALDAASGEVSPGLPDPWSDALHDWPALRRRCHDYVQSRTLDAWAERAGRLCASSWHLSLVSGKLRPCA